MYENVCVPPKHVRKISEMQTCDISQPERVCSVRAKLGEQLARLCGVACRKARLAAREKCRRLCCIYTNVRQPECQQNVCITWLRLYWLSAMTFIFTIKLVNKDNFFFFGCWQTTSMLNTENAFLLGEVAAPPRAAPRHRGTRRIDCYDVIAARFTTSIFEFRIAVIFLISDTLCSVCVGCSL
jgi:hypothetical protein